MGEIGPGYRKYTEGKTGYRKRKKKTAFFSVPFSDSITANIWSFFFNHLLSWHDCTFPVFFITSKLGFLLLLSE